MSTTGSRSPYRSLNEALRDHRLPLENDILIRRVVNHLGIVEFYDCGSYIKGVRPGTTKNALHIYYGHTSGFVSEDEARRAVADDTTPVLRSQRAKKMWRITHPKHSPGRSTRSRATPRPARAVVTCPEHHITLPASGRCDLCDG